uniref:C-type lectin domain-containing protein n=1 Tax=Xiphophorus maculatus TaxID=8083 RepID=A0A3B5PUB2_XIPMA
AAQSYCRKEHTDLVSGLDQFHYINENKTWTEAQQYCREKHTDLATVTNMKDMKRLISVSLGDIKEVWIGLYDQRNVNRAWYWSLPGVEFNKSQNCGIIWKDDSNFLKWGDLSCNDQHNFICYNGEKIVIWFSKNWTGAQSYCRANHTDLISGMKQLQDGEVNKGLNLMTANSRYIFIGLFSDTWRWSDGNSSSFRHWNLHTVILIKENKTWEDALNYCRENHHGLVTITDSDEQRLVQQIAQFASTPFVWTGLHYACTLDLWFWVSDEVVIYKNWNQDGPMDDCDMSGAMETGGKHQWFKKNDPEKFNFICSQHPPGE